MAQQTIILTVALVLAFSGAGYFYSQYTSSQNALVDLREQFSLLKDEKNEADTELAVLKSTDLAKEVELLQVKLKIAERDFAAKEKELVTTLQEKVSVTLQLQTARANSAKIRSRLDAIDATERMVGAGPNAGSVATVDQKIAAVKDTDVMGAWATAKQDIDFAKMSWNGNTIADAVMSLTRSIRNLLP